MSSPVIDPATPAMNPEAANAKSLARPRLTPDATAARSFARIASIWRPMPLLRRNATSTPSEHGDDQHQHPNSGRG